MSRDKPPTGSSGKRMASIAALVFQVEHGQQDLAVFGIHKGQSKPAEEAAPRPTPKQGGTTLKGFLGVSKAMRKLRPRSEFDEARPRRDLFKGVMGVALAMRRFRELRQNRFRDDHEMQGRGRRSKSAHSFAEIDARRSSSLVASAEQLVRAAEIEKKLMMNPPKELAIVMAAKRRDWAAVENELRECKKGNPRINAADPRTGETTLMFACQNSRFLLINRLCEMGVSMNTRAEDRQTALHYVAAEGHEEIVRLLLKNRADPNLFGGKNNQLPLHIAAARTVGGLIPAQHLLRASLKESRLLRDGLGNLAITYAVESGSNVLVKELLQNFAKEQIAWRHQVTGDHLVHLTARKKYAEIMNALGLEGGADMDVQNKDGQTPLHISAKLGDEAMIKLLQPFKPNPDIIDKKERTPLHVAAEHGHTAIVELLVERYQANAHMRTKDGSTLMHLAADRGFVQTVLAFIKSGVPLNMPNKAGALCLHIAAQNGHVEVVEVLIRKGSNVNARTKEGYTALHLAVLNRKPLVIQVLLGAGAKVDLRGGLLKEAPLHIASRLSDGHYCADMLIKSGAIVNNSAEETLDTPLHISARSGATELMRLLLEEGADPMGVNKAGESALHVAVRNCWFESAKAIVSFVNDKSSGREATNLVNLANYEGESCFHLASELGKSQTHHPFEDVDIIRLLLENGAEPLSVTKLTNETSLHYCARSGNTDVLHEIVRHLKGIFQLACNRQDRLGYSPLMTACKQGHAPVSEILLENGARADVFDEFGKAALHLAAENGHMACCEILLAHKAFVNAKSKLGITPLHFAAQSGFANLARLLILKYHATLNALSLDKKTPLHMAAAAGRKDVCLVLMKLRADANAVDAYGQNPLHLAAENDHSDVVKLFIKFKPELVTAASKGGMTCGHIAAKNGSEAVIKLLMQFNKQLVTHVRNQVNEALPIHLAVSASHKNVVKILIDAGSSPTAENHEGMTAIHMVAKEGNMEVLQAITTSSPKEALRMNSRKNGLSPLHIAAFYGKSEIIRELQTSVDINSKTDQPLMAGVVSDSELKAIISTDYGLTPLHMASLRGHESVVRLILNNSSVRTEVVTDFLARVPLHYACQNGHAVVVSILMSRSPDHLRLQDRMGRFPLHLSAENGHVEMVSTLLGQGADVNCTDKESWTPLHYATRNGHLDVVKLLIEIGALPIMKTIDGKIALSLSAKGGHLDVLYYLLNKEHDSDYLIEDRDFMMDLMVCSKTTGNEAVDEFVMHSGAPLDIAAKLAKLYREMASKEKERGKDLSDIGRHCEHMATELLGIAASVASPSTILRTRDSKGKQLLDMFLDNDMKEVVEHASVQRYLSDIWAGSLSSWSSARFFGLFLGFLFFPPLLAYFCLPFKHHSYHRIPIIKFIAMIVSHLYFMFLLTIVSAIPLDPIIYREDFFPLWYELLLLAWASGMLVAELAKADASTGLGIMRYLIIVSTLIAALFQTAAIILDTGFAGQDSIAMNLMYLRNFMLSLAILFASILIIDFLLIHHLFGPFGILIGRVMKDLLTFIVVLFLFLIAFTFLVCCLFSPVTKPMAGNGTNASNDTGQVNVTASNLTRNVGSLDIGKNLSTTPTSFTPHSVNPQAAEKKRIKRIRRADSNKEPIAKLGVTKPACKPKTTATLSRQKRKAPKIAAIASSDRDTGAQKTYDHVGRQLPLLEGRNYANNRDVMTLVKLFDTFYFGMYQLIDRDLLPLVENGPDWSSTILQIYMCAWLTVSSIVLLPLLIAAMADSYKQVYMRSDYEWKFSRAKLIRAMVKMTAAPPPLNLLVRPYLYLVSVAKHGGMMCTVYANYFVEEDEHEGNDESVREVQKAQNAVPERVDSILDWSTVVRRYKATIKGDTRELLAIAADEEKMKAVRETEKNDEIIDKK